MAWYTVKYSCGHEDRIQLYGPERERRNKIEYLEKHSICKACWEEQRRIDAEAKAKRAGLIEVEVSYREYKEKWPEAQQIPGSYNGESKTIHIYLPADQATEVSEKAAQL